MRLLLLFLSLITIACTNKSNQSDKLFDTTKRDTVQMMKNGPASDSVSTDSAITRIRAAFQQINTAPLKSQKFKWEATNCNNDGTATYYLTNKNEIVKVVETGVIGDGSWTTAYYYQEGRFIFSLQTDIGGPAIGPVDTIIIRKYVYADKVIRSISNKPYTATEDGVLTAASKEYKILAAYKSKDFGAAFCE